MSDKVERPGIKNLRPSRDTETAKARGKLGGIKSGQVRRERRLLSDVYADLLAKEFELDGNPEGLKGVVKAVLARGDSSSVQMLKEIREATEGSKVNLDTTVEIVVKQSIGGI